MSATISTAPPTSAILEKKIRKIIDSGIENDPETVSALEELSEFFPENSLKTRRALRGDIEKRNLGINLEYLAEMSKLKAAMDDVYSQIRSMDSDCAKMEKELYDTKSKTRNLIEKTSDLRQKSAALAEKADIIEQFTKKFSLTESEIDALSPNGSDLSPDFFLAMDRIEEIRKDVELLLHTGRQKTALDIMEKMTEYYDGGLEKLYRWTLGKIRCGGEGQNELKKAVCYLQERQPLFKVLLSEYNGNRKSVLVESFLNALTTGGPGGTPKPIELHAHDSLRYVSDMFAWIHQNYPLEVEGVKSLLEKCDEINKQTVIEDSLGSITEGLCRPLETRVEQLILTEKDPVVLFRLSNLIGFYSNTFTSTLFSSSSPLVRLFTDLEALSSERFGILLDSAVTFAISKSESIFPDLSPVASTMGLLTLLKELSSTTSSGYLDDGNSSSKIISSIIDPLVSSLRNHSGLSSLENDVYVLNSLGAIHYALSTSFFSEEEKCNKLHLEMESRLDTLSAEVTSSLVSRLRLQTMMSHLKDSSGLMELANSFSESFDEFLISPVSYLSPVIENLSSEKHRKTVVSRVLSVVLVSYKEIYEVLKAPKGPLTKTPDQISFLLN